MGPTPTTDDPGRLAEAHTARGVELAGRRRYREALAEFRAAVALIPENAIARNNLGMTLGQAGAIEGDETLLAEAIEQHRIAVRLQPDAIVLRHTLAAVLALADRVPESLDVLNEALALDPSNPKTRALRSVALLTLGHFEEGWNDFEFRLADPAFRGHDVPGIPRWRGETIPGTLLLNGWTEGHGDCIQGIRFAAEARRRVGSTVLLCPPSLARLLSRCEGVDRIVTNRQDLPPLAAQIAPMYLASVFRPTPETLSVGGPYLSAEPSAIERWRPSLDVLPRPRVGIAWQGNPGYNLDACRSFPIAALAPIAAAPGVQLIALQKGQGVEQMAKVPFPLIDLGPEYAAGDWHETAAVLAHLDLVIAPDTAIAHLAGAIGRPTWMALSRPSDWRWMIDREDSPWYPSMRLFRQERPGHWDPVFHKMAESLRDGQV